MDILHVWQIKMVAIQLLCLIGVVWGFRYLGKSRGKYRMSRQKAAQSFILPDKPRRPEPKSFSLK